MIISVDKEILTTFIVGVHEEKKTNPDIDARPTETLNWSKCLRSGKLGNQNFSMYQKLLAKNGKIFFKRLLYEQKSALSIFGVAKYRVGRFQVPNSDELKQNGIEQKIWHYI